ncbi:MAG: biotin/lipoyl-binding protein, partial [Alphaproteobacteria bacterium]
MPIRKKRIVLLVLIAAAAAGGGYGAYDFLARRESPPTDITLYGNIDIREADLAFNVSGRIESMQVEEGDSIEKGQLLATLEDTLYRAEVEAAKARVEAQRAVLDRLLAGSRPEEIKE